MPAQNTNPPTQYAATLGIDWGDRVHFWSLQPAGSADRERGALPATPEAVREFFQQLQQRFSGPIAVAVEQKRGALLTMLTSFERVHVYPVHPSTSHQFRSALHPSGAKDDGKDANLLLELLLHHRSHLWRYHPDTSETRALQLLVEKRRTMVNENTRLTNRLRAQLKEYFPQILAWFSRVDTPLVAAFLKRWPELELLQRTRPATLRDFFARHNCRNQVRMQWRIDQIREAVPLTGDPAVLLVGKLMTRCLLEQIAACREAIARLEREIEAVAGKHPDEAIFRSLPGAGPVLFPRLISAFGTQRERFGSAGEFASWCGIAPVVRRSGQMMRVSHRVACPKFVRQTFQEFAGHSVAYSGWSRAFYDQQRSRGKRHHAAVRSLAYKWIRIIFRCWKDRRPYEEAVHLRSLRRDVRAMGSPVETLWKEVAGFSQISSILPLSP